MTLHSMTGFARATGSGHGHVWVWELKSVNGKGLEVRCRLPYGQDALEIEARKRAQGQLARGNVSMNLALTRDQGAGPAVDAARLKAALAALRAFAADEGLVEPTLGDLLAVKGVMDAPEALPEEEELEALRAALLESLDVALGQLAASRKSEGAALACILATLVNEIEALVGAARAADGARLETIRARFAEKVAELLPPNTVDSARIEQELAVLAVKADVREELDRLDAHIAAARDLLAKGASMGRKLDFLAQEFNREANTLCSKSSDTALTAIGLDLKAAIDRFREQIQNVE